MDREEAMERFLAAVKNEIQIYCQETGSKYLSTRITYSIRFIFKNEFAVVIFKTANGTSSVVRLPYLNPLDVGSIIRLRTDLSRNPGTFAILGESGEIYMLDRRYNYDLRKIYTIPFVYFEETSITIPAPLNRYQYIPFLTPISTAVYPRTILSHRTVPPTTSPFNDSNHRNVTSTSNNVDALLSISNSGQDSEQDLHSFPAAPPTYRHHPGLDEQELNQMRRYHSQAFDEIMRGTYAEHNPHL